MINLLSKLWDKVSLTKDLSCEEDYTTVDNLFRLREQHEEEINQLKVKLKDTIREKKEVEHLSVAIADSLDDMVWAKTLNGEYIMVNKAFRQKFCYGLEWEDIKGKTDIELAKKFKSMVGDSNHTFGEVCSNSDVIIHEVEEARQFLESGKINGKMTRLIVNKSPLYDCDGVFYATCGTGRDVTDFYDRLKMLVQDTDSCFGVRGEEFIKKVYENIEFRNDDG